MQNPPPGPPPGPPSGDQPPPVPPGYQPPQYQPSYQPAASSGIDKRTGAILSYLLWWITGIVFLFVGRGDPDVKYHAAQSTIFFGAITALGIVVRIIDIAVGSLALALLLGLINFAVWVFGVVVWIMCLIRASSQGGARFQLPLVGGIVTPYAEQLANAV